MICSILITTEILDVLLGNVFSSETLSLVIRKYDNLNTIQNIKIRLKISI